MRRAADPLRYATGRRIRLLAEATMRLRPRRARCIRCRATHVLLPAWCLPPRGDAAEVVGAALVAKAAGHGHRVTAAQLGRPAATVRGWLRRAGDRHARWLYDRPRRPRQPGPRAQPARRRRAGRRLALLGQATTSALWWRNDFDWAGIRMTSAALARYPNARPWRMAAKDYLSAVGPGQPLLGAPADTPWDEQLASEMKTAARSVMEERLLHDLLDDLCSG
jgi:hypothetical protein